MKIVSSHGQLTFDEMKGSFERLPKTNRWVHIGDSLRWAEYEKVYNKPLKNDTVSPSIALDVWLSPPLSSNTSWFFR